MMTPTYEREWSPEEELESYRVLERRAVPAFSSKGLAHDKTEPLPGQTTAGFFPDEGGLE